MSESLRVWLEVGFNVGYLISIWTLVAMMWLHRGRVAAGAWPVAQLFLAAFALLGLGDTGHVGFRVLALGGGDIERVVRVGGVSVGIVGLGALATAVTVTLFYVLMLFAWKRRFDKPWDWFGVLLLAAAALRLILMLFPQNQWSLAVPPQPWSLYRNAPLMLTGLGCAWLMLRDAGRVGDHTFRAIGWWIVASYTFYTPVILFVQRWPLVGMLMIPKTLCYVAIAVIAYRSWYARAAHDLVRPPAGEIFAPPNAV
jgi:hypothetical protein